MAATLWTPTISPEHLKSVSQEPGLSLDWYGENPFENEGTPCLDSTPTTVTSMYFSQLRLEHIPKVYFIRVRSTFTAPETCEYRFALSARGSAYLKVDGKLAIDLWEDHPERMGDTPFFNTFSSERYFVMSVQKGQAYDLDILLCNEPPGGVLPSSGGVRLGGTPVRDDDVAIEAAVQLAREVDFPIVLAGTRSDYEFEGADRTDLLLPKRQNEMIERVCDANPKTVSKYCSSRPIHWRDEGKNNKLT